MRSTSRIGMVATGLVLCAAVVLWLQADDTPDGGARNGAALSASDNPGGQLPAFGEASAADTSAESADLALPPLPAPDESPPSTASIASLAGRITRAADGTPVAGVAVSVHAQQDGQYVKAPLAETGQPVTDTDGRYRLDFTEACTVVRLLVGCGPDTTVGRRDVDVPLQAGRTEQLDLQVGAGGVLSGLVVDTEGRPVPGATVRGWCENSRSLRSEWREPDRTTLSDSAGGFVIGGLGPSFLLAADAPGYACLEMLSGLLPEGARLGLPAGGAPVEPPLVLVLSPQREVRGRVLGPDGAPVARAWVLAAPVEDPVPDDVTAVTDVYHEDTWRLERRTAEDGSFHFQAASVPYDVSVSVRDLPGWKGTHSPGDPELLVQLQAGITLAGTVTAARDGAPVAGAEVYLHQYLHQETATRSDITDETGRFLLSGLLPADVGELDVAAAGFAIALLKPVAVAESGNPDLHIALDPEQVLAGRVVDADGAPVGGASVEIEGDRIVDMGGTIVYPVPTWESRVGLDSTSTDGDGRFRLGQLYAGTFKVRARHPRLDHLRASLTAPSGRQDLLLVLGADAAAGFTLAGRATDAFTGRPVTSFEIVPLLPVSGTFGGEAHFFDDPAGAFRITGLPAGDVIVHASAPGYATWKTRLTADEGSEQALDVRFVAMRSVRLRVVDPETKPVEAGLSFRDAQGETLMVNESPGVSFLTMHTDEAGEALVHGLPAERITVKVSPDTRYAEKDFALDLRSEPHGPIELRLDAPTRATLHVLVLGAAAGEQPAPPDELERWAEQLPGKLAQGAVWPIESDAIVRVLGAASAVVAEARLDVAASESGDMQATRHLVPSAARPATADLEVPLGEVLTLQVEAEGYATSSQAVTPPAEGGDVFALVLLRRR